MKFMFSALVLVFQIQVMAQVKVEFQTTLGAIVVEVDTVNAPISALHFLEHVNGGTYAVGAAFYRVLHMQNQPNNDVKIEVIQGGLKDDEIIELYKPIAHETTEATGLKHLDGTLSMARMSPGTASTEFFICIGDQPELDFGGKRNPDGQGFAAFGEVISGMEIVRAIQQTKSTAQILDKPIEIMAAKIIKP